MDTNELLAAALHPEDILAQDDMEVTAQAVLYLRVSTSRQAHKNGEAEGYSIPAQRDACTRKVGELGAEVVREFTDAGASARSADRDGLQEMLAFIAENAVSYVVVHKLDRLARDRADDVAILLAIKSAGATLVSVTENIDDTPAGKLQHGIMASMAEYYSSNLSHEAKKGIAQKAKNGGTHGVAPIGYLNTVTRIEGREIKGVAVDAERADHIRWAFQTYATGEVSISLLRDLLEERGLRSRKTLKYIGNPLSNAQVHRLLGNPYYVGKIVHRGVVYDGAHESLVDEETWYQVQAVRAGRRIAGDRSWKHDHFLKGSLMCNRCEGRMGFGYSRGKGGVYAYFFCLGRHTGRTACDLPYIPATELEREVRREWRRKVRFSQEEVAAVAEDINAQLELHQRSNVALAEAQQRRLVALERKKQRLIDAYLEGVLSADDLKPRQAGIITEIEDAKRLIRATKQNMKIVRERIAFVLRLMTKAVDLYDAVDDTHKGWLNKAVFAEIRVGMLEDGDISPDERGEVWVEADFAEPVASLGHMAQQATLATKARHTARRGARTAQHRQTTRQDKTPGELSLVGGSNLTHLAVTVGFEPTVGGYPTQLFESCTFGRSDTSPSSSLRHVAGCREPRPVRPRRDLRPGQRVPRGWRLKP